MKIKLITATLFALAIGFTSCNSGGKNDKNQKDTISKVDTVAEIDLMVVSEKIVKAIKAKDYETFVNFIHPSEGVRFSAMSSFDAKDDKVLTKEQILDLSKTKKPFTWGIQEGIGDHIKLNIDKYFNEFVYDVDFLTVGKKQINKITNINNSPNNINEVFPKSEFVEFYFAGEKGKYDGLDWKALILVFKKENNNAYLVGVSHSQWAP